MNQNFIKTFGFIFALFLVTSHCVLAKHHKQTTRRTTQATTQTPPPYSHPPPSSFNQPQQSNYQPQPQGGFQPSYQPQPGYGHQPGFNQQPQVVHVMPQQTSSGGIGTAGGLALGAIGGAAAGYAINEALNDDKKEEEKSSTTAAPSTTTSTAILSSSIALNDTSTVFVTPVPENLNSTTLSAAMDSTSTTLMTSSTGTPVNEPLVNEHNSTATLNAPKSAATNLTSGISFTFAFLSLFVKLIIV